MTRSHYGTGCRPLAVAHRGGAGLAAENTPDAFDRSYALGVRHRGVPTIGEVLDAFPDACFTIGVQDEVAIAPLARTLIRTGAAYRSVRPVPGTAGWRDCATGSARS